VCTYTEQVRGASYLTSLFLGVECLRVFSIPGGINVEETRSGIPCHVDSDRGYGPENLGYGARRRHRNYGSRIGTSTTNALEGRQRTGTANTLEGRQRAGTTNALVKPS
jgi:hypothetical protein